MVREIPARVAHPGGVDPHPDSTLEEKNRSGSDSGNFIFMERKKSILEKKIVSASDRLFPTTDLDSDPNKKHRIRNPASSDLQ